MSTNPLPDYSVHGHGDTTLFLLHGAFGAKEYWRAQIQAATATGYRVVAWDAPGYGISPMPPSFSIEAAAERCVALIRATGTDCNIVLGHSMGGMIAQRTFDYAPQAVHGLILSATSAAFGGKGGEWQQKFVADRVAPLDAGQTIPEYAPKMLRRMMNPSIQSATVDLVIDTVSLMREETFRAAIQAITEFEGRDIIPKMNEHRLPVLCVAGELDLSAAPPQVMQKLAYKISDAEFACMQGVGHFGWAEAPDKFNHLMLDFMKRRF
ncbi:MAG: putative non-heme bromoperoxidase BpoC [Pseudomonadota bacterium]|jgi:pimeloyl-ACP methyl ester carboxylesterase